MGLERVQAYEGEIDLRELINKLWKQKIVILGVTLALALVGGVISLAAPQKYQATAMVTLYQPTLFSNSGGIGVTSTDVDGSQLQMNLPSNGLQSFYSSVRPTASDLVNLVTSDELMGSVLASPEISTKFPDLHLTELQSQTKAIAVGNSLLQLQVTQEKPEGTAILANAWAAALAEKLNDAYGISDGDIKLVESQAANAQQARGQAEANLSQELKRNQGAGLNVQLNQEKAALQAYLDKKSGLDLLANDLQRLQALLGKMAPDTLLPPDQALSILSLEQQAVAAPNTNIPQLQIAASGIFGSNYTVGNAQTALDDFSASLKQEQSLLDSGVAQTQAQILVTQTTLEKESHALDEAILARDQTKAQYLTLSMQLQQMQLYNQSAPVAKVTSVAIPPQEAVSRHVLTNTILAAVLGLMLSVFGVLAIDWWKTSVPQAK